MGTSRQPLGSGQGTARVGRILRGNLGKKDDGRAKEEGGKKDKTLNFCSTKFEWILIQLIIANGNKEQLGVGTGQGEGEQKAKQGI